MITTRRTANDEALAAFVTRKAEIDAMLERLAGLLRRLLWPRA
jgi:hypothetical protein